MASACRAAAAALVKSFPPAVAAPFCMLVGDVLLEQHAGYRGIGWRKTFQESPRKARSSASARHGEARRGAPGRWRRPDTLRGLSKHKQDSLVK